MGATIITVDEFDYFVFGATGDLAKKKLLPALYHRFIDGQIPSAARIIGCARSPLDTEGFRALVTQALSDNASGPIAPASLSAFLALLVYQTIDVGNPSDWHQLVTIVNQTRDDRITVFYLSVGPSLFEPIVKGLKEHGLNHTSRLVLEKPLGFDLASATHLNNLLRESFDESRIYRIDHYLGKETVQNLMALRFANILFEPLWNAHYIDHVQITAAETLGVEGRAGFYDGAGAMRDMVQNHLLQLLGLVAMESPNKMGANNIRTEKIKVLQALRPITGDAVKRYTVRGQYVAGNIDNKLEPGYLEELGCGHSQTETFVAIRANIDNWRWAKVPFYIRTGKRLKRRSAEIVIQFKDVSHNAFDDEAGQLVPNRLIIQLQPEERMQLLLMAKDMTQLKTILKPVKLDLNFTESSKGFKSFGYKRLLLDAIAGNASLFIHRDEGSAAWHWVDPIIDYWKENNVVPFLYRAGTWGPSEADDLLSKDKREWIDIEA